MSQKRKDISFPDMECKHSKTAKDLSFCLFMKLCRKFIQSNEELNPLAVMRWPENDVFLLEQFKNWIENKLSGFNALKIISSLRQETIYRSPGAGQQMAVTRYSVWIHMENRDSFCQGASKSQMLLWDAHVPPAKRVTIGRDWYIVSMEVFVDKIDLCGRRLDNRNPEFHVKVTLHVAKWPPPEDTRTLDPRSPKLNHDAIHADHQNMNVSRCSYYKPGDGILSRLIALSILLLYFPLATGYPVPQSHQVEIEIPQGKLNCTLNMDNNYSQCYGHCCQNKKQIVQSLVGDFCKQQQQKDLDTNLLSLNAIHNIKSGTLQLNLIWKLNKDFNVIKVAVQYIFNGKKLTDEEIANLPMPIADPQKDHGHLSSSVFIEKMNDYAKTLWGKFREELLPFLQKSDPPETTTSLPPTETTTSLPTTENTTSNTKFKAPGIFAISIIIAIYVLIAIVIVVCIKYEEKTSKMVWETNTKVTYSPVAQSEPQGDPNGMKAQEDQGEDQVTISF